MNLNTLLSADHKVMRLINRMNVLDIIREQAPISRVRIASVTGLRKPTISSIVNELIGEGLVYEDSPESSPIGRRPISLRFNNSCRVYGSVDITRSKTSVTVCDLGGKVLRSKHLPTLCGSGKEFFTECARELAGMLDSFDRPAAGIGVVVPCAVNSREGKLFCDRHLGWSELNVRGVFENYFDLPVHVENDARAAALAELWFAPALRGVSSFVFLLVSGGLRSGTVIGNRLYYGANFRDGRFGPGEVRANGKRETSPVYNPIENSASDIGLVSLYCRFAGIDDVGPVEPRFEHIIELAHRGDHNAVRAFRETASSLASAVGNIRRSLDPERIVIGGSLVRAWNLIYPELARGGMDVDESGVVSNTAGQVVPSSLANPTGEGIRALVLRGWLNSVELHPRRSSAPGVGMWEQLQGAV